MRVYNYCEHSPLGVHLVHEGLFPSSPVKCQYAFDISFMDFYFHLFQQSATSAEAVAAALAAFHKQVGFIVSNPDVRLLADMLIRI